MDSAARPARQLLLRVPGNHEADLLLGHDADAILARKSAGTLTVREDELGLAFRARLVETNLGDDVLHLVRTGHLTGCSFAFTVADDEWEQRDGRPHRIIREVGKLYELTLTGVPAYGETHVRQLEARQATTAKRGRLKVKEPTPYGEGGRYSWFSDLAVMERSRVVAHELISQAALRDGGRPHTGWQSMPGLPDDAFDPERAARRLATVPEIRTMSTTATAGGGFVPSGSIPSFVVDAFGLGVHNVAVLAAALRTEPLPDVGMTVVGARISATPGTTAVQTSENAAISDSSPSTATSGGAIAMIAGKIDLSVQLLERSAPTADQWLAEELGRAFGEDFDQQIVNGQASSGELDGLLHLSGTTSVTSSTATAVANVATLGKLRDNVSVASGIDPDTLLAHPRRLAFIVGTLGYPWSPPVPGSGVIAVPSIPVNLGAGTNQDAMLLLARDQVILFTAPPQFETFAEVGSATLTARIRVYGCAALVVRQPLAVGKATGAGLVTPSYTT